jgi:hypothetical protein
VQVDIRVLAQQRPAAASCCGDEVGAKRGVTA